jgi:hypothetical protein
MATSKKTNDDDKPAAKRSSKAKLESSVEEPRFGQPFNVSWDADDAISLRQAGPDGNYVWDVSAEGEQPVAATVIGTYTFTLSDGAGKAIASLAVTVKA